MRSWRDELPAELPRHDMMLEAVRRGGARRRRRQGRVAALGGALGVLAVLLAVSAPFGSEGAGNHEHDVHVLGSAGAGWPQESTPALEQPAPVEPPATTAATLEPRTLPTSPVPAPPQAEVAPPSPAAPATTVAGRGDQAQVTGSPPPSAPATGQPGAPDFVAAGGNAATRRIMIRFTRPVVPGTVDVAPARLVLHAAGDSTCSTPTGSASDYPAGSGTDTITAQVTGLVIGTTYISIAPGFVKNAHDGTENTATGCVGIPVKG